MKKILCLALCVFMLLGIIPAMAEGEDITIFVDGVQLIARDATGALVYPVVVDGTTYLPVRAIGQAFFKAVEWDAATNTVFVGDKGPMAQLYTDNIKIVIDGVNIDPRDVNGNSVPPFALNGTTYLPVRAVGEAFNKNVVWDGEARSISLNEKTDPNADELDGKYFRIYQRTTHKSLAVENASKNDSALIVVTNYADNDSQIWEFGAMGGGYYTMINRGSGKSIDIPAADSNRGVKATQYTANNGGNQQVKAEKNADGSYSFSFRHSGLYLTASDTYTSQENYAGNDSQCFTLEYVGEGYMTQVLTSPGFAALGDKGERFRAYVYSNADISRNIKAQAQKLLTSRNYFNLDANSQRVLLEECMTFTAGFQVGGTIDPSNKANYEIVNVEYNPSYDVWRGTMKPVWIYHVRMDGDVPGQVHEFQMISTVQAGTGGAGSIPEDAIRAISRFPYAVRKFLNRLIYRDDEANNYNGGGDTIWMRINWVPNEDQIAGTLAHELGHVLDTNLTGDYGIWERAIAADAVPMSGYGNSNRTEDLAEYSHLYHASKNDPQLLATIESIYPNRAKAYRALLYAGDRTYYAQYKNDYLEISGLLANGVTEKAIALVGSSKVLTVADNNAGSKVTLAEYTGADQQLWFLYPTTDGSYVAFNKASGMCLNVPGNSTEFGTALIQWNGGTGNNEKMTMVTNADGSFTLRFKESGLYLSSSGDNAIQGNTTAWTLR